MTRQFFLSTAPMFSLLLALNLRAETLTLGDAERRAVTDALEVRAQHFEERSKAWAKKRAVADYMPSVGYTMSYLRMYDKTVSEANRAFESMFPPDVPMPRNPNMLYENSFSHEISVSQPVTNGGAEIISIRMASLAKEAAQLQQEAIKQEVIYRVRKAYFDARAAVERTAVARQSLAWSRQNLGNSRIRHEAGAVPYTDLLQWEAEVVRKESELVAAEAVERFTLLSLFQAMGQAPQDADERVQLLPMATFEQWYLKGPASPAGSVEGNPQLKAVKTFSALAKESKNLALSAFLPKLNAFYAYSWQPWDRLKPQDFGKGWTAGIVLSIPIFSGRRNSTSYRKSQYDYLKARVEQKQVRNALEVNLERIALFYKAAYEAVKAAHKQQELMDEQLAIMQKRYDGGLVNQLQLLEVALGVEQTRIGYTQKLLECLLLEAEYLKALGELEVAP